jgi:ribosome-binding factor A
MALVSTHADEKATDASMLVSDEDLATFPKVLFHMETSAKTGQNVQDLFWQIIESLP